MHQIYSNNRFILIPFHNIFLILFIFQTSKEINVMQLDGDSCVIHSWDGARDAVGRPHGRGRVTYTGSGKAETILCFLDHSVIIGSSLWHCVEGFRAVPFNSNGKTNGCSLLYNHQNEVTLQSYQNGDMVSVFKTSNNKYIAF